MNDEAASITITFERDADPNRRLPALMDAFNHVMDQTTVPGNWRIGLLMLWIQSQLVDHGAQDFAALSPLTEIEWDWPAFNKVREIFRRDDAWPSPWHHYKAAAKDLRRPMKVERVKLLMVNLRMTLAAREGCQGDRLDRILRHGCTVRCESAVALPYVTAASDVLDPSNWKTWPPYFPGDTSTVVPNG